LTERGKILAFLGGGLPMEGNKTKFALFVPPFLCIREHGIKCGIVLDKTMNVCYNMERSAFLFVVTNTV
jgi:hypothetical protein